MNKVVRKKSRWGCSLVCLALSLLLLIFAVPALVQASSTKQENPPEETQVDCRGCHWNIYLNWEQSAHGQGLSCSQCHLASEENHARQGHGAQGGAEACMDCHTTGYDPDTDTWQEDDVHCTACHTPVPANHPDSPMPISRSDELCGTCHIQAHFEWLESAHGQAGVVCVSCHSQHTTSLKSSSISAQCANCHETYTEGFSHSIHFGEGLSCANCHLAPLDNPVGGGNAKRSHTFDVAVETCVGCHKAGLHDAVDPTQSNTHTTYQSGLSDPTDALASSVGNSVSVEPPALNISGFVSLGGFTLGIGVGSFLLGMAIVLLPWFMRWYRRLRRSRIGT